MSEHNHHEHEHEHHGCAVRSRRTSKLDRLIMLVLVLAGCLLFLRPLVGYQSYMRGYSYTEINEPRKAVKHLERAVMLDEDNYAAWSLLGYNYVKLGERQRAEACYQIALEINPEDIQAAIELALLYFYDGNYEAAIRILKKYLREQESHTDGWILLATCYEKAGEKEKAQTTWRLIYEKIDPGNVVAKSKLSK